jgi:DNA mismatch repair protein MSH2
MERATAITCLPPLFRHLQLLSNTTTGVRFKLLSFDVANFMRLDKAAVRALNLFPAASDSNRAQSLFGLLNKCRTAMGQRLLAQWLKQPLLSLPDIERRLNFVEAFVEDTQLRQSLQVPIFCLRSS